MGWFVPHPHAFLVWTSPSFPSADLVKGRGRGREEEEEEEKEEEEEEEEEEGEEERAKGEGEVILPSVSFHGIGFWQL